MVIRVIVGSHPEPVGSRAGRCGIVVEVEYSST